ncbi:MAG: periplasmic heavy metal sensor [Candidatus Aminicenantes bacterium]|nr:periplasmic heavy metal sensor [Candidatus Aminicenantes bacterium]
MNRKTAFSLLLTVSLALNLAFLAALVYRRSRPRPPAPPEFRSDLSLTAPQDEKVREIVRQFKINSIMFREDILNKRVEIIEELGDPLCDPQKLASKTGELNDLENQLNRDFIAALLKISDVLQPGQRLDMLYKLSRNWFFFQGGRERGGPHE